MKRVGKAARPWKSHAVRRAVLPIDLGEGASSMMAIVRNEIVPIKQKNQESQEVITSIKTERRTCTCRYAWSLIVHSLRQEWPRDVAQRKGCGGLGTEDSDAASI